MAVTHVTLKFIVASNKVQEFLESMTAHAETLADGYRCPAVSTGDERCELPRDHESRRHVNGNSSWPVRVDCIPDIRL